MNQKQPSRKGPIALVIASVALCLGTLWGFLGTVAGMIRAFNRMAYSGAVSDPIQLNRDIGEALIPTIIGLLITLIGIALLIVAIIWLIRVNKRMKTIEPSAPPLPRARGGHSCG